MGTTTLRAAGILLALAACRPPGPPPSSPEETPVTTSAAPALPALDRAVPQTIETATFALG